MDDFRDMPATIGEVRSDRSGTASDWSPRDLLVSLLRDIDSGKVNLDAAIVIWLEKDEKFPRYRIASKNPVITLGMLQATIHDCVTKP